MGNDKGKWVEQVEDFFTHLLQRVVPKHDVQARAEVTVTRRFLENFSGDQVRFQPEVHVCLITTEGMLL